MMSLPQKIIIYILHALGLLFAYGAAGVVCRLLFRVHFPMFTFVQTIAYSAGVLIALPFIAIACFMAGGKKYIFNKVLAGLYLLLWFGVVIKIVFFTS